MLLKKTLLILLTGLALFVTPAISAEVHSSVRLEVSKQTTVYITKTGSKYHTSGCRYLSQSKIKTSKKEAVKNGLGACKVCRP
jgi:hypothetical protein